MVFHNRYCFVIHVYTCSIAMFTTELEQAGWRHLDMEKSSILTCLWSKYWTASQSYSLNFNDVHLVIPFNVNCFFVTNIFLWNIYNVFNYFSYQGNYVFINVHSLVIFMHIYSQCWTTIQDGEAIQCSSCIVRYDW